MTNQKQNSGSQIKTTGALVLAATIMLGVWVSSYFVIDALAESDPEVAGQIGDRFGAINSLFSGLALLLIALSLFQTNKSIRIQHKELKDQNESWILITYLNVLGLLKNSGDATDVRLADVQLTPVRKHLKKKVEKLVGELRELTEEEREEIEALQVIEALFETVRQLKVNDSGFYDFVQIAPALQQAADLPSGVTRFHPKNAMGHALGFAATSYTADEHAKQRLQAVLNSSRLRLTALLDTIIP